MKSNNLFGIEDTIDTKYTTKVNIPQYLPNCEKPSIDELVDTKKYESILMEINSSNIPEREKIFLRLAACRHLVFNYSKIADYYAHSEKELQKLMEKSALVIIDVDDAIANGYVKLSENIRRIYQKDKSSRVEGQ